MYHMFTSPRGARRAALRRGRRRRGPGAAGGSLGAGGGRRSLLEPRLIYWLFIILFCIVTLVGYVCCFRIFALLQRWDKHPLYVRRQRRRRRRRQAAAARARTGVRGGDRPGGALCCFCLSIRVFYPVSFTVVFLLFIHVFILHPSLLLYCLSGSLIILCAYVIIGLSFLPGGARRVSAEAAARGGGGRTKMIDKQETTKHNNA